MFTKTIKKYIGLALVLAFCSASSMAQSLTKVLTAAQYQPTIVATAYGLGEGVVVTGTTVAGCGTTTPLYILMAPIQLIPGTNEATRLELYPREIVMEMLTKGKVSNRSLKITYIPTTASGDSVCRFESITMQ